MKKRWWLIVLGATACATDAVPEGPREEPPDAGDAGGDAGVATDAAEAEAEAGPCDDCAYFPETCTADSLCPNGPFDPATPGGAFDGRAQVTAIRGRSASDVWLAGTLGALAHFDGTSWARSDSGNRETMLGLWLRDSSEIAVGVLDGSTSTQRIYARGPGAPDAGAPPSDGGWTAAAPPLPPDYNPVGYVVAAGGARDADWLWITMSSVFGYQDTTTSGLLRVRQGADHAFEIGLGPASSCWPGCNHMRSIHGASASELWAVGANGVTIRVRAAESDAPTTTLYDSWTSNTLNGVWAASDSEAWSVGALGTIRHYTGKPVDWDVTSDIPTSDDLNAVWGSSSTDVWAVGDAGVVLHFDGARWSRVKIAGLGSRRPKLTAVWTSGPGHVWIGGQGTLLSLGGKP